MQIQPQISNSMPNVMLFCPFVFSRALEHLQHVDEKRLATNLSLTQVVGIYFNAGLKIVYQCLSRQLEQFLSTGTQTGQPFFLGGIGMWRKNSAFHASNVIPAKTISRQCQPELEPRRYFVYDSSFCEASKLLALVFNYFKKEVLLDKRDK